MAKYIALIVGVLLLSGCVVTAPQPKSGISSQSLNQQLPQKIAIFVQENRFARSQNRNIEDTFISGLLVKGYSIATRSDMDSITKEMKFQQSGLTDSDASKLGKMLNVPAVLIISVTNLKTRSYRGKYSTEGSMSARLVSVEHAEILWINSANYTPLFSFNSGNGESDVLAYLSNQLVASFPIAASGTSRVISEQ